MIRLLCNRTGGLDIYCKKVKKQDLKDNFNVVIKNFLEEVEREKLFFPALEFGVDKGETVVIAIEDELGEYSDIDLEVKCSGDFLSDVLGCKITDSKSEAVLLYTNFYEENSFILDVELSEMDESGVKIVSKGYVLEGVGYFVLNTDFQVESIGGDIISDASVSYEPESSWDSFGGVVDVLYQDDETVYNYSFSEGDIKKGLSPEKLEEFFEEISEE